jgi:hypothetical protein
MYPADLIKGQGYDRFSLFLIFNVLNREMPHTFLKDGAKRLHNFRQFKL